MRLLSAERFLAVASARSLTGCYAVAPDAVPLRPAGSITTGALDFSFADLRTAVARWVEARQDAGQPVPVSDVGASFQEAVAGVLTRKAVQACWQHSVADLLIGGGTAASSRTSRVYISGNWS